jgi:7-cyano-7-deazaguanine synthase
LDSATCLFLARREGYPTRALTIAIHGTSRGELSAARRIGRRAGVVEHRFESLPGMREAQDIRGSPQLSRATVPRTYIPMKNVVFYAFAAAYAEEKGSQVIIGGHNADDRRLFDDTSDEFFQSLEKTLISSSPRLRRVGLTILRPLRDRTKVEVVELGADLGVPFELTWSCHRGGSEHCWKCEGCLQRTRAFEESGIVDPLASKKV